MQLRLALSLFFVGAALLAGCSKISTKNISSPSPENPASPPAESVSPPTAPAAPSTPSSPQASLPHSVPFGTPPPASTVPAVDEAALPQAPMQSVDLEGSAEKRKKAIREFNDQVDQAMALPPADPEAARSSALANRRAAKMKAVREKNVQALGDQ